MICDSEVNLVFISDQLEPRYPLLVDGMRGILGDHGIPLRIISGANDIWCRDFMPIQVAPGEFVQFCYSPDYLICYEYTVTNLDDIDPIPVIASCDRSEVVLDGGNVVCWGNRAIVTDKVFRANPRLKKDQLTCWTASGPATG